MEDLQDDTEGIIEKWLKKKKEEKWHQDVLIFMTYLDNSFIW